MKKSAFTMIELIFVIVILGILASVAIPKLTSTQKSAKAQKVEAFVGTMNRTVLPSMYTAAIRGTGSIVNFKVSDYLEVPNDITLLSDTISATECGSDFTKFADTDVGAIIYCRDGNSTNQPVLSFKNNELNATLDKSYFQ